jgi:hypothetical protein
MKTAIVVWFAIGREHSTGPHEGRPMAAFVTPEESEDKAQQRLSDIARAWNRRQNPRLTPPNVITSDHPNYASAVATGKLWEG